MKCSQWNFQNLECAFIPLSPSLLSVRFTYFMTFTDTILLGYNTVSLGNQFLTMQFYLVASSSGIDLFKCFLDFLTLKNEAIEPPATPLQQPKNFMIPYDIL